MQFDHIDNKALEYIIGTPHTPHPLINHMGCEKFYASFQTLAADISSTATYVCTA